MIWIRPFYKFLYIGLHSASYTVSGVEPVMVTTFPPLIHMPRVFWKNLMFL